MTRAAVGAGLTGSAVPVDTLTARVRQHFVDEGTAPTPVSVAAAVRADDASAVLGEVTLRRLAGQIAGELGGVGPLTPLVDDPAVTDVLVNGDQVWVDRGDGLQPVRLALGNPEDVRRLAQRLAAMAGRRLDESSPYVDAQLPDGTRLHAVLAPVARGGPYLSLRTFRRRAFALTDLVSAGTVEPEVAGLLTAIVAARLPYVVSGGTGSGKTTVLNALLALVPADERIVVVEDAAELRPDHPHVVALQSRPPNVEGAGEITLRDLVRQALRMRPDRLVIGECRGAEVVDLLCALNTGHEGGAATVHANAPVDVPARLEALGLLGGVPREALHAQLAAALRVVIHLRRVATGRVVDEICLLSPATDGELVSVTPVWRRGSGLGSGRNAFATLLARHGAPPPAILAGSAWKSR